MRAVVEGRRSRKQAAANYAELHDSHRTGFGILLFVQRMLPWIPSRLLGPAFRIYKTQALIDLTFNAYLELAPPSFAAETSGSARPRWTADDDRGAERDPGRLNQLGAPVALGSSGCCPGSAG